jgi:hypothetical protein
MWLEFFKVKHSGFQIFYLQIFVHVNAEYIKDSEVLLHLVSESKCFLGATDNEARCDFVFEFTEQKWWTS